jgi:cell division protein FtsZ
VNPISTPIKEEKKTFELFEQTPNQEITPTFTPTVENEIEAVTPIHEEPKVEEKIVITESTQKYSWDVVDVKTNEVTNETPVDIVSTSSENVTPKSEEKTIIRHELELEPKSNPSFDNSPKKEVLTSEEMARRTNERMSKIQELTTKLKKAEGISEFENEPAYVRRNINLNTETPSTATPYSKFGLSGNPDGSATLRGNNFLHDNVD